MFNKRLFGIIIVLVILIFAVAGIFLNYKKSPQNFSSGKIKATASFYPVYFFTKQIAGDRADVMNITPAGVEPHDFEPSAKDIAQIESAKILILNGGNLEPWSGSIKQNIDTQNTIIVTAGDGLINQVSDPHIWLDPKMAKIMTDKILQGFFQIDPKNKDYYQSNADILESKLTALDDDYKQGLANCKESSIITSHSAFGYLASAYGLKQISIAGLSPDTEPTSQQLINIVKFAKENNVKYIFFESLVSPKLADMIANEIGAKTLVLNPIEGLTDQEVSSGKNYFTEMEKNLINLRTALNCK